MPRELTFVDLNNFSILTDRIESTTGKYFRSLDIDQTTGIIYATEPLNTVGLITYYPLNPNNTDYSSGSISTIKGTNSINFPLDTRIDYFRNNLWVADAGNNRLLLIDNRNSKFILEVKDLNIPHALAVDLNTGKCFIKSYVSTSIGNVKEINLDGSVSASFDFNTTFPYSTLDIDRSVTWCDSLPLMHSITFDHTNSKIWWISETVVYMADTNNKSIAVYDLADDDFTDTKTINVDFNTGFAFVVALDVHNDWYIAQLNKYNSKFLGKAYISN